MVVVLKTDNKVHVCVDPKKLNECVKQEHHMLPAVDQILAQLEGVTMFSKSGLWQIPLSAKSVLLTICITLFSQFCFQRLPFEITSDPEHFQRRISENLTGTESGTLSLINDVLVHGGTQEHDKALLQSLTCLQDAGVTLNKQKCHFSVSRINFLSHVINFLGIYPDPDKGKAVQEMEAPTDVSGVCRSLGIINQ